MEISFESELKRHFVRITSRPLKLFRDLDHDQDTTLQIRYRSAKPFLTELIYAVLCTPDIISWRYVLALPLLTNDSRVTSCMLKLKNASVTRSNRRYILDIA